MSDSNDFSVLAMLAETSPLAEKILQYGVLLDDPYHYQLACLIEGAAKISSPLQQP